MTAFRAAFKAYRMHQVLIMPRFARLTIALGLATAVFPVDAEYYFNPRFLSNDLAESVDLSAFTKGREAPPGTENTIKKYLQCTNIQTVTVPVPAKFLRASNVPTGLLNEMIAYLNSEERNHHNFSELLLFSCLSIFAACKGFITLLTNGVLSVSGKVRNIVNMKLAHPWKLKDICDCLYISESLLKKKLKQEQTTFSQILLDARMQHAKNLIRVEGSVNKIAEQCGYASTSYFIYAFRKHFGNSPKRVSKEYRCQSHTGMNTGNTMSALAI